MRIIKDSFLKAAAGKHPRAAEGISRWMKAVRAAHWKTPADLPGTLPDADAVKVRSGHTVWVCNIRRNEFRLVIAVHFNRGRVYALRFMTHAEYNRNQWKQEL